MGKRQKRKMSQAKPKQTKKSRTLTTEEKRAQQQDPCEPALPPASSHIDRSSSDLTFFVKPSTSNDIFDEFRDLMTSEWNLPQENCFVVGEAFTGFIFVECVDSEQFEELNSMHSVTLSEGTVMEFIAHSKAQMVADAVKREDADLLAELIRFFPATVDEPEMKREDASEIGNPFNNGAAIFSSLHFTRKGVPVSFGARFYRFSGGEFSARVKLKGPDFGGDLPAKMSLRANSICLWDVVINDGSRSGLKLTYNSDTEILENKRKHVKAKLWNVLDLPSCPVALNESPLDEIAQTRVHSLDGGTTEVIGPTLARKIVNERDELPFFDWDDLAKRVFTKKLSRSRCSARSDSAEWITRLRNENIELTSFRGFQNLLFQNPQLGYVNVRFGSSARTLHLKNSLLDPRCTLENREAVKKQGLFTNVGGKPVRKWRKGVLQRRNGGSGFRRVVPCDCSNDLGDDLLPLRQDSLQKRCKQTHALSDNREVEHPPSSKHRIGRVVVYLPHEGPFKKWYPLYGTATVIGDDMRSILTCAHVLENSKPANSYKKNGNSFFELSYSGNDLKSGRPRSPKDFVLQKMSLDSPDRPNTFAIIDRKLNDEYEYGDHALTKAQDGVEAHCSYCLVEVDKLDYSKPCKKNFPPPEVDFALGFLDRSAASVLPAECSWELGISQHNCLLRGTEVMMAGYGDTLPPVLPPGVVRGDLQCEYITSSTGVVRRSGKGISGVDFLSETTVFGRAGHSGGPVFVTEGDKHTLVGITVAGHDDTTEKGCYCSQDALITPSVLDRFYAWMEAETLRARDREQQSLIKR